MMFIPDSHIHCCLLGCMWLIKLCRQRIPPKNVFYYRCPDHQKNYILSFAFAFDKEDDIYQVGKLSSCVKSG